MDKINILIDFQRRVAIPSVVISAVLGTFGGAEFFLRGMAFAYLLVSSLIHYFIYEVMNKNVYIFYANMGLSRWFLWRSTIIIGLVLILLSGLYGSIAGR